MNPSWRSRRWLGLSLTTLLSIWQPTAVASASAADATRTQARLPGRLIVRYRAGLSADNLLQALNRHGARRVRNVSQLGAIVVESEEADLPSVERGLRLSGLFKNVERDYLARVAEVPNDPYYPTQWGLPQTAVPAAWNLSTGSATAPVAVVDTGVDFAHPDLSGRLLPGYDILNDDPDPSDDNGHGTRMTGVIVARRGNGEGTAGVAPDTAVIPVKVLGADGSGPYSAVASGITYAVDQGARVVNLSLAGGAASSLLQSAIDYATAHGVVAVAAAGNSGTSTPAYPAACSGAVAVGATNYLDQRASFSNYGAWLAIAAPGVDIVTTSLGATYSSSSGTSPATAFASGVFALLLPGAPGIGREAAIERVEAGTTDLGATGWDPYYGWGRVDAYAALVPGQPPTPPPDTTSPTVSIVSPVKGSLVYGMLPVDVVASDNAAISRVELFVDNVLQATETSAPYQFVLDTTAFSAGKHKLRAYAYDAAGNAAKSKSVRVLFTPGAGLLVRRAKAKPTSISVSAVFALPSGVTFDATRDAVTVVLSSADATVFSVTAQVTEMLSDRGGNVEATVVPAVPPTGSAWLGLSASGTQPTYKLKLSAVDLSGLTGMDTLMNFSVQVGDTRLSHGLTFRWKSDTVLVYP